MSLKARDLTPDVRQAILDQIRTQLGYSEYNRLVGALGEDQMIDLVLEQAASEQANQRASAKPAARPKATQEEKEGLRKILFYVSLLTAFAGGAYYPDGVYLGQVFDKIFYWVLGGLFVLVLLFWLIAKFANTGMPYDGSNIFWVAILVSLTIASLVGSVVNLAKLGWIILGIAVVLFFYTYLAGAIFFLPIYPPVSRIKSGVLRWILYIIGAVVVIGLWVFGFAVLPGMIFG